MKQVKQENEQLKSKEKRIMNEKDRQIKEKENEIREKRKEINKKEKQIKEKNNKIGEKEKENERYQDQIEQLKQEIIEKNNQIMEKQKQNQTYQTQIEEITDSMNEKEKKNQRYQSQVEEMKNEIIAKDSKLKEYDDKNREKGNEQMKQECGSSDNEDEVKGQTKNKSKNNKSVKKKNIALSNFHVPPCREDGANGSQTMVYLQWYLRCLDYDMIIDGNFDKNSITGLQKFLNLLGNRLSVDGTLGKNTITAFQTFLKSKLEEYSKIGGKFRYINKVDSDDNFGRSRTYALQRVLNIEFKRLNDENKVLFPLINEDGIYGSETKIGVQLFLLSNGYNVNEIHSNIVAGNVRLWQMYLNNNLSNYRMSVLVDGEWGSDCTESVCALLGVKSSKSMNKETVLALQKHMNQHFTKRNESLGAASSGTELYEEHKSNKTYNSVYRMKNALVLILCISKYGNDGWSDLNGPKFDIKLLKELWEEKFGFDILCNEPSKEHNNEYYLSNDSFSTKLDLARIALKNDEKKYDGFIFVFSGHGYKDSIVTSKGEITINRIKQQFSAKEVKSFADKPKVYIFDCCRNGDVGASYPNQEESDLRLANKGSQPKHDYYHPYSNVLEIYGNTPGYQVKDLKGGGSLIVPLTKRLTDYVNKLNVLDEQRFDDLLGEVCVTVNKQRNGNQVPQISKTLLGFKLYVGTKSSRLN